MRSLSRGKDGEISPSDAETDKGGSSDQAGMLADRRPPPDAKAGRTDARGTEDARADLVGGGGARELAESQQAAEVLLRQIKDNPARVLSARLKAIYRERQEAKR